MAPDIIGNAYRVMFGYRCGNGDAVADRDSLSDARSGIINAYLFGAEMAIDDAQWHCRHNFSQEGIDAFSRIMRRDDKWQVCMHRLIRRGGFQVRLCYRRVFTIPD